MFPISGENSVECVKGFFMKKSYLYKVYLSHVKLTTNIKLRFFYFSFVIFSSLQTSSVIFGNLGQFLGIFGSLWKSSDIIGNCRRIAENSLIY